MADVSLELRICVRLVRVLLHCVVLAKQQRFSATSFWWPCANLPLTVYRWQLALTSHKDIGLSSAFRCMRVRIDGDKDSWLLRLRRKNLSSEVPRVSQCRSQWLRSTYLLWSFWLLIGAHQLGSKHVRLLERVGSVKDLNEVLFAISGMLLKVYVLLAILVLRSIFGGWR